MGGLEGWFSSGPFRVFCILRPLQFWKQFFESSANVSLSGYEEQPSMQEPVDETVTDESHATTHTTLETSQSYETPSSQHISANPPEDELDLSSLTISPSHSTPRPNAAARAQKQDHTASFADYPSPYEALRQEIGNTTQPQDLTSQTEPPQTPGRPGGAIPETKDIAMTPGSSPFLPPAPTSIPRPSTARKKTDPLLHRVLDRNYRVQATPMASVHRGGNQRRAKGPGNKASTATPGPAGGRQNLFDSTLSSSPEMPAAPQLHAEIFSPPAKLAGKSTTSSMVPGVSVLTPAKVATAGKEFWDSDDLDEDDDEEDFAGASPPKTMQFHIPQSKLLKTPGKYISNSGRTAQCPVIQIGKQVTDSDFVITAKEASKRIVEDLLLTAGVGSGGDDEDDFLLDDVDEQMMMGGEPTSPSLVRKAANIEDESF